MSAHPPAHSSFWPVVQCSFQAAGGKEFPVNPQCLLLGLDMGYAHPGSASYRGLYFLSVAPLWASSGPHSTAHTCSPPSMAPATSLLPQTSSRILMKQMGANAPGWKYLSRDCRAGPRSQATYSDMKEEKQNSHVLSVTVLGPCKGSRWYHDLGEVLKVVSPPSLHT